LSQWERVSEGRVRVTLKVFDVLGREVATLVDGEMDSGKHSVVFNAKDLPSGVYFYRLTTPTFSETKPMEVLK
ncbi:MAG: T9SS type A sorting domain-containing protein, partial [Caldisericum exile]|uniref:T9SS type A sorting domain-containing protein n=1 Tax=Caldisericum exile TaxID=693075 RepID=UPI003C772F3B